MSSAHWVLSDQDTLAEYVPLEDFKGMLQQRIGVSPDHAALLIRDGRLVRTYTGGHFSVGGLWQNLKNFLGGEHAVRLLVADLKPFQITGEIEGISSDQVPVAATATFEFQLDPEKPENILGLMRERVSLTRSDVYERLRPHLRDRVFATVLKQVEAAAIRGNTALQDRLQADIMVETERLFGDSGLLVRAVSMNWALNDEERAAMERRGRERQQEWLDYEFERRKRELERENETREFAVRSDVEAEKLRVSSADDLQHLLLQNELRLLDARQQGARVQQLKQLEHDIELLNVERHASYQQALEDAQNQVERAELTRQLTEVELQTEEMRELQRLKLSRLQEEQNLDIAARARQQQLDAMRGLSEAELDSEERRRRLEREDRTAAHQMDLESKRQEAQSELDKLKAQATMTPEQLLALKAGLSPEVARIFSERVRAEAMGADTQQALLREMLELAKEHRTASDAQARFFFDRAMQGVAAVAQGGASAESSSGTDERTAAMVVCSACHREIPASDRFCRFCGHATRP